MGEELLATQPLAFGRAMGRASPLEQRAVGDPTSTDRLVVEWTDTLTAEAKSNLEASLDRMAPGPLARGSDVDVRVESPEIAP